MREGLRNEGPPSAHHLTNLVITSPSPALAEAADVALHAALGELELALALGAGADEGLAAVVAQVQLRRGGGGGGGHPHPPGGRACGGQDPVRRPPPPGSGPLALPQPQPPRD